MKEAAMPGFLCASQHISRRNPDAKSFVNGSRMIRDFMLCCFVCCSVERTQMRRRLMRCESLSGQMSFLWELSGSNVARKLLMWSLMNFIACKVKLAFKEQFLTSLLVSSFNLSFSHRQFTFRFP